MATARGKTQGYIYPKDFFERNKPSIQEGLCFVLMPFEERMNEVYDQVIAKTLVELGFAPVRADRIFDTKPIMISVMEKIAQAEVIIADVTGRNPNVFYELGMSHVLKERVILFAQEIEDVPFDLRPFRVVLYDQTIEGAAKLRVNLIETLRSREILGQPTGTLPEDSERMPARTPLTGLADVKTMPISATSAGDTQLVAAVPGKRIRLVNYAVVVSADVTVKFRDNAETPNDLTGGMPLAARGGIDRNPGRGFVGETAVGKALMINLSVEATVGGDLTYEVVD